MRVGERYKFKLIKIKMKTTHNNHPISIGERKSKGVMIRKWDYNDKGSYYNPSSINLNKQIKTLHKKLKKRDCVYTEYSIERDRNDKKYHIHLIIHYSDEKNLSDTLINYIGGTEWKLREMGLNTFNECNGRFGMVHTENIDDINKYRGYINKTNLSKTLI
jgi:hypothetical protein